MNYTKRIILISAATIALTAAFSAAAQSGRRFPKQPRPSVPDPAVTVNTTPRPAPAPERKKPETAVRVFSDINSVLGGGYGEPQRLHTYAVERLKRVLSLETIDGGASTRSIVSKRAKTEEDGAYTVLFELRDDPFARSRYASSLEVLILSPITGKVKASRRIDLGSTRGTLTSRSVLRTCYPDAYGRELLVIEAGIEAADYVLSAFNMPAPPLCGRSIY